MPSPTNVVAPFRTALYRLIRSTLPEVISPIATVPQIQRVNWVNAIKAGTLTAPWVTVHIPGLVPETEFTPLDALTWRVSPTIYYIESVSAGSGSIGDFLEDRLAILSNALLFGLLYTIPPGETPIIDASEDNPVNISLLNNDMPYLCGSLSFSALVGYTN